MVSAEDSLSYEFTFSHLLFISAILYAIIINIMTEKAFYASTYCTTLHLPAISSAKCNHALPIVNVNHHLH